MLPGVDGFEICKEIRDSKDIPIIIVSAKKDDIDKYLVLEKNPDNVALYKGLPEYCKKFVVWRDTPEHLKLYVEADMFLVAQSYRDVRPENVLGKKLDLSTEKLSVKTKQKKCNRGKEPFHSTDSE